MSPPTPSTPPQQLPGYELVERLGAGAYGEVWKARAPGGLVKAIKYVYGELEGRHAAAELKALERVKELRHPYLLSLERIEVLDGRLVVVSELADSSLRDLCHDCLQQGLQGIPRSDLLRYLSEAAEALDYLAEQQKLQHLDVKPENLLVLAGHVKVADFGLVKSISDTSQSIVGGMTPLYAAPEVFQGLPGWRSDQYSLAVMYQELLTGVAPFEGANAAELTMRHLNEEPNLAPLPEGDRFVLSRALAKSPESRFESCVAFASALANAEQDTVPTFAPAKVKEPAARSSAAPVAERVTEFFDGDQGDDRLRTPILINLPEPPGPVQYASPPEIGASEFTLSPAVFIGLGGIGAQVLIRLRSKLNKQFGEATARTAFPMLLLDTDPKALQTIVRDGAGPRLFEPEETLLLPLRRPQEYRDKASATLRWLSRRWLYNIPRSLRTEGIRPLGRLALLDHARQAVQRVKATATSAVAEQTRADAAEQGLSLRRDSLRVYIVSSITGGTGGAMTTDFAYAIRAILERIGLEDPTIIGLMLNAAVRGADRGELARVNAYAWLTEHQHFLRPDKAYPGAESAGLPAHPPGTPVFDHTYLVDYGPAQDANGLAERADNTAEYLFQDAATPTQQAMDACRAADGVPSVGLRTFRLHRSESTPPEERSAAAYQVAKRLVADWSGSDIAAVNADDKDKTSHLVRGVATLAKRLQLDTAGMISTCRAALEQTSALAPCGTPRVSYVEIAAALSASLTEQLSDDLRGRIFKPGERLLGAYRAAKWYLSSIASVHSDLQKLTEQVQKELGQGRSPNDEPKQRASLAALQLAILVTERLTSKLRAIQSWTEDAASQLRRASEEIAGGMTESVDKSWVRRLDEMVADASDALTENLKEKPTSLFETDPAQVATLMSQTVDRLVTTTIDLGSSKTPNAGLEANRGVAEELPPLSEFGGVVRRVLVENSRPAELTFGGDVGPALHVPSVNEASCLILEGAELPLAHVANQLVGGRRDYADLATRVQTRRDIDWTSPLSPTTKPAEPIDTTSLPAAPANTTVPTSVMPT